MEEENLQPLEPLEAFFQDPERPVICSFNFPAVVLTVGRDRWPDLRESYLQIASNPNVRVRRTLAASLGEIANIIGEEYAAVDLMPIWWDAIRSEETDVRIKAVESMGKLMAASGGKRRIDVMRGLLALWEEGHFKSWREREGIAMALNGLAALTESQGASTLQQLLLKALHDGLPGIWATFGSDAKSELHAHIISLAHSSNYRQRMTFISCMQTMLATPVIHAAIVGYNDYWSSLAVLARDGIVGVRIGVARVVGDLLRTGEFSRSSHTFSSSSLLEITDVLQADTCSEVRAYLPQGLTSESAHVDVLGTSATRVHNGKGSIFSKPPPPAPSVVELSSALGGEATSSQSPRWVPPSSQAGLALLGELQHSSVAAMGSSFPVPQPEHAIYAAAS
ncbi:hypothetical protein ONZ45_g18471 [Pleurotus djamor]|nr:hypothetical protein ONZ45_g18471 [Pleurotus djamor]